MHAQTRRHRHIKENKTEALRALPWYCSDVRFRLIVFCVRPFKLNQQATTLKHPKKPQSYQEVLKSTTHWFNELRSQSSGAFSFECCDRTEIFFLRSVIMCVSYFGWINHQLIIPFSRLFLFSELAKWVYKMFELIRVCLDHSLSLNHLKQFFSQQKRYYQEERTDSAGRSGYSPSNNWNKRLLFER